MNNGLQFGSEGPMMSGTWWNPQTGHKFTVRDCYFLDNQFMVLTTDGQQLDYNTIQNYVQCTDDQGKEIDPPASPVSTAAEAPLPKEVSDMIEMLPEDQEIISKSLGNLNDRHIAPAGEHGSTLHATQTLGYMQVVPNSAYAVDESDYKMIDRVLSRHDGPEMNAEIVWNKLPRKQIDTLVNVLGIDPKTVAMYYLAKLDMSLIYKVIESKMTKYIADLVGEEYEESVETTASTEEPAALTKEAARTPTKRNKTKKS